ncbi:vesicle-associated membrane protein 4 isoform X2 [Calonectris borealis]|uniref:vesicle-associated membrane protein 4 isoform X2 n=1 Tax=Calonectris borealis TaxID=1323832 RepID=UPI003F4BC172
MKRKTFFCGGLGIKTFDSFEMISWSRGIERELGLNRRGPSGPRFGPRNDKIRHVQNQVDEVIDVMQENITKVIERGERLDDLQDKSESLSDNATAFSNRAKQLRRQMWWRGCKMKAIMALVAVILLLVIIGRRSNSALCMQNDVFQGSKQPSTAAQTFRAAGSGGFSSHRSWPGAALELFLLLRQNPRGPLSC